jgi:hypothetical protein
LVTVEFRGHEWNEWVLAGEVADVLRRVEESAGLFIFLAGLLNQEGVMV